MANLKTFIDTSGFFPAFVPDDPLRNSVDAFLHDSTRIFYTTDWILGETVNLLTARRFPHQARKFLRYLDGSPGLQIIYGGREMFDKAKALLLQYADQSLPFTDCTSFVVMRELRIHDALTTDKHFKMMGFNAMLGSS